jgi:hypothetical protein
MKEELTATDLTEETRKVIPFPAAHLPISENLTSATTTGISYTPVATLSDLGVQRKSERRVLESGAFRAVGSRDLITLHAAFERISHVLLYEFETAERSNCFDEWKDLLEMGSRRIDSFTGNHRKILGTLLSVTRSRDISDFSIGMLYIFRDATNMLRLPRVGKQDARRVVVEILKQGEKILMPLTVDESSEDKDESLERMLAQLILKSRKD